LKASLSIDIIDDDSHFSQYSKLKWNFNHFTGVDYNENDGKTSIFRIQGDGKYWARGVDRENQNYDYLSMSLLHSFIQTC